MTWTGVLVLADGFPSTGPSIPQHQAVPLVATPQVNQMPAEREEKEIPDGLWIATGTFDPTVTTVLPLSTGLDTGLPS
jgi:hypothetical protein